MEEAIGDLVLTPFQDIVIQGNIAVANARDAGNDQMVKAAQALVKEGERALKKIEPLCKKHFDESGPHFVNALKDNEEISQFSEELTNLLYDFEDYVQADAFEADKFAELQALCRKAAPRIGHIVTRMKLPTAQPEQEPRPGDLSRTNTLQQVPPVEPAGQTPQPQVTLTSPIVTPSAETPLVVQHAPAEPEQASVGGFTVDAGAVDLPNEPQQEAMGFQSGPERGLHDSSSPTRVRRNPSVGSVSPSKVRTMPAIEEDPPPEPPEDAWTRSAQLPPPAIGEEDQMEAEHDRRGRLSASNSPVEPASPATQVPPELGTASRPRRLDDGAAYLEEQERQSRSRETNPFRTNARSSPTPPVQSQFQHTASPRPPSNPFFPSQQVSPIIPSNESIYESNSLSRLASLSPNLNPRDSVASSGNDSIQSSVFDRRERDSYHETISPITIGNRNSAASAANAPSPVATMSASFGRAPVPDPNSAQFQNQNSQRNWSAAVEQQPGLEAVVPTQNIPDGLIPVDEGLIPVEGESSSSASASRQQSHSEEPRPTRQADCTITLASSFYLFRGFCDGAREVMQGGLGVKRVRKQGLSTGAMEIAKCKACPYELEWKQVERDVNSEDSGNLMTDGVGFRLRFLSKSHIPAKHVDDQIYGCLFCIQQGRTVEESDATVFFSQRQLFAHLARHPRPLPPVPGLTVIQGKEIPAKFRNNYDLWLPREPEASQMAAIARELSAQPTAIAVETFRASPGRNGGAIRRPADNHRVVQFGVGARIVGVEFPARYGGEWCTGWTDHQWGVFPSEMIRLDPPPKREIRMQGSSNMKAIARWKWSMKGKEQQGDWLKFDKGDVITGISWAWAEHWCWSGTNSKGKWGLFPQSHIEPNSLKETPVSSDRASIASSEMRKQRLFSRMSIRGRSSSYDADPTSPRPSIH